jgi:hypothetical protein
LVGLIGWAQAWAMQTQGAVILVFGIYMAQAAGLHLFDPSERNAKRAAQLVNVVFAACLLLFGSLALLHA